MLRSIIAGFVGVVALSSPILADVQYQYVTDASSYTVDVNTSLAAQVFLQETVTDGSNSILVSEDGLFGAGLSVSRSSSLPTSPASITGVLGNSSFDGDQIPNFTSSNATLLEVISVSAANGVQPVDMGSGIRRILLGSVTIAAGSAPGETTSFTLAKYNDLNTNTITNSNLYDLDVTQTSTPAYSGANSSTFAVTTTAIPEPSTALALGLIGLALRRSSRK